jgi:hypothetical protein
MKIQTLGSILLSTLLAIPAAAQISGAIYTSTASGTVVNQNSFSSKPDVYLNGGPQNLHGAGLPNGIYYYEVTDPSTNNLLSTDDAVCRQLVVAGGVISGAYTNGGTILCAHPAGAFNPASGATPVQLIPFLDTTNNGGVYKVTLISQDAGIGCTPVVAGDNKTITVAGGCKKSDNFRIALSCELTNSCPPPPTTTLSGVKFYDANVNHALDSGEVGVAGVTINLYLSGHVVPDATGITDGAGNWFFVDVPVNTDFKVCEDTTVAPINSPLWQQTAPTSGDTAGPATADASRCWNGNVAVATVPNLNFGNVTRVTGTKYYDTNNNGVPNNGEPPIDGFRVVICVTSSGCTPPNVSGTTTTSGGGNYFFFLPAAGSNYQICELVPPQTGHAGTYWAQTGPLAGAFPINNLGSGSAQANTVKCWLGSGPVSGMYLTNVCRLSGGKTLGFWSNKNGQAQETVADFTALTAFHLRDGAGNDKDFLGTLSANKTALNAWLLGGSAVNMSYMLSVQMTATFLSTQHGLDGTTLVDASGFGLPSSISINQLIANADALLAADGNAVSGDPNRTLQEQYKSAFDAINNNLLPLTPGSCTPSY